MTSEELEDYADRFEIDRRSWIAEEGLDAGIIGFYENEDAVRVFVYGYNHMINALVDADGMDEEMAEDWILKNTIPSIRCMAVKPIVVHEALV